MSVLQRGDPVPMEVTAQGAVRVNDANVERAYDDCILLYVDLHSKYAEMLCTTCSDDDGPEVLLTANEHTLHLDNSHPRGSATMIRFPTLKGWRVFAAYGPGRYTLSLVLVSPDTEPRDMP